MQGQPPEPPAVPGRPRVPATPGDPGLLRVSDADRHRVADRLREAAGEGRLDLEELDERLEATYRAKTYADLRPITADLPADAAQARAAAVRPPAVVPAEAYPSSLALMSTTRRTGRWLVQDGHTAVAVMGTVVLDLREAQLERPETTVYARAVMGEVRVIVDAGTRVAVEGLGVMGEFCEQRSRVPFDPDAGGPLVRVLGVAVMGSVHVQRKGPPGQLVRTWLGLRGS